MDFDQPQEQSASTQVPYPAMTKQAAGLVNGVPTDIMFMSFADKIMVTITQEGRLAQWIHVPLGSANPNHSEQYLPASSDEGDLLPMAHLTPKTLLGGSTSERETMGQLYATQIATAITSKNPDESRIVLVGLGLKKVEASRETFFDIVELMFKCL
ncbi:MAG: hypothetical protein FRX48_07049 [Lasallia pustulata]|uniref:Uncharacterized protein n=1 Tax=Lasallia pustulata TaxID=136370 RepID=A0A5M8PKP4_9LECA|nr:MAG: hypothetical protein FRX48_07049 [Lasallia pustulata]